MAVSKTNFINWTRCPRYCALEKVKKERLMADVTYEAYMQEEKEEYLKELLNEMIAVNEDGEEEDLTLVVNHQLEAMMPYYKKVEDLASKAALKRFGGSVISSDDNFKQKSFTFVKNNIKYLCYVDVYNETDTNINIIEVKATTSKKYAELQVGLRGKEKSPLFYKKDNIYYLKDISDFSLEEEKDYENKKSKLLDRYSKEGKYIYDLAVQRFFIENTLNETTNFKYYLGVLNHEYVYDGESDYEKDREGNEIITFIDLTDLTKELMPSLQTTCHILEGYLKTLSIKEIDLGRSCEYKKQTECRYFKPVCGHKIPKKNSSLNYLNNNYGFKDEYGIYHHGLDLINEGYLNMLDIPESWIKNPNHRIEREALITKTPYINKEKIKNLLDTIEYPIYHLDFETFPCPIPRFKNEKCYEQSPFQFSLHIEREPGVCDEFKDNYYYLVSSFADEREELTKKLCELIDPKKGTMLAQNVPFEKNVIKKLANYYPEYRSHLLKIYDMGFDLIWLLKTNKEIYMNLGYNEEEAKIVNYYDEKFSGSYSIKKTLPVFSSLSYDNLDIKNGTEAIVAYSTFPYLTKEEIEEKRRNLITYCGQDTWAMVVILDALRKIVN